MAVNNSINEAMDVQTFTSTGAGTWTKPNGAKFVYVVCVGGGGGGGAGGSRAAVKQEWEVQVVVVVLFSTKLLVAA